MQVEQSLTVTQNKLGDLLYRQGKLEQAHTLYLKALRARQAVAESSKGAAKLTAELDLAFSLAKAADIEQAS